MIITAGGVHEQMGANRSYILPSFIASGRAFVQNIYIQFRKFPPDAGIYGIYHAVEGARNSDVMKRERRLVSAFAATLKVKGHEVIHFRTEDDCVGDFSLLQLYPEHTAIDVSDTDSLREYLMEPHRRNWTPEYKNEPWNQHKSSFTAPIGGEWADGTATMSNAGGFSRVHRAMNFQPLSFEDVDYLQCCDSCSAPVAMYEESEYDFGYKTDKHTGSNLLHTMPKHQVKIGSAIPHYVVQATNDCKLEYAEWLRQVNIVCEKSEDDCTPEDKALIKQPPASEDKRGKHHMDKFVVQEYGTTESDSITYSLKQMEDFIIQVQTNHTCKS
jgi:hypothetical protein